MAVNVKLGVDTSAFKSNIQEATAQLKTFDAQLKYAEATMKATGNAEQGLTTKMNALNGKLETQKRMAQQMSQQLERMRQAGVDPLSKEYQKLATSLLNVSTGIVETESELNNLTISETKAADGADKLTQSVNGISKKVSLDQVISGISSITSGLENAAKKAVDFGEKLFSVIMDSAAQADDIGTMSDRLGLSEEEIQQINYNAERFEVTAEQLGTTWKKLKKNMASDNKEIVEGFEELGVQTHEILVGKYGNVIGDARDFKDVFWETGEALLRMSDATKQEELAQKLLGRSWDELIPLFKAGREAYETALKNAPTASDEAIDNLADLNARMAELEESWNTLKLEALGAIAPALEKGADAIANLLDKITEYLKTDEGQKLLENLGTAISGMISDIGNIDPESVVSTFSSIFSGIIESFEWLTTHWQEVKDALAGIAIGFGMLKVTSLGLNIVKMIDGFKTLFGGGGGGNGGTPTGTWNGGGSGVWLTATKLASNLASNLTMYDQTGSAALIKDAVMDLTTYGWERKTGKSVGEALRAEWGEITKGLDAEGIAASAEEARRYWFEQVPDAFWGIFGFKSAQEGATKVSNNLSAMNGYVIDREITADEAMRIINGEPIDMVLNPVVEDGEEQIQEQVGTVTIPAKLSINGFVTGGGLLDRILGMFDIGGRGFANGLPWVMNDGLYLLHRGERVLTASENKSYTYNNNNYFGNVNLNNGQDIDALCDKIDRHNRRNQRGFGE